MTMSLTCVASKVLESIIRHHILCHFRLNNLFSKNQYGYIKVWSTVLQLLAVQDNWTQNLEDGGQIDVIYTDFAEAFDKVPRKRLLAKLKRLGINTEILAWIECFLTGRNQKVKINSVMSDWYSVISEIPQGSVFGPLLFII